jgi:hypothetical protein
MPEAAMILDSPVEPTGLTVQLRVIAAGYQAQGASKLDLTR